MMKLGCNAMLRNPNNREQWLDVELLTEFVHDLKFDVIDFQLDRGFRSTDRDYLFEIKSRCQHYGLPIGYLGIGGGFVGQKDSSQGLLGEALSASELHRRIEEAKRAVDAATFLSAPLIRIFAGCIPEDSEHHERLRDGMIQSFRTVADYALAKGIFVGLHNHPPVIEPTGNELLKLLRDIDRKNVTLILDTGRWPGSPGTNMEGVHDPRLSFYNDIETVAPYAAYVRAKIYKIDQGYEEWLDYERIIGALKSVHYNGCVSIVFEDRGNRCSYEESIRLASQYLRSLLNA